MNEQLEEDIKQPTLKVNYDYLLTSDSSDINNIIEEFENIDNYGIYISNMRNKIDMTKKFEEYFGPTSPLKRKSLEKKIGKPFPVKTKQKIDELVKSLIRKPTLLYYEKIDNSLVFDGNKNPPKHMLERIIKTVMNNANISYVIKRIENYNI
jgi:hypothetical protein